MKHINFVIDSNGGIHPAHPMAKPEFGKIMRITDIPDDVAMDTVLQKADGCAFWHSATTAPFAPTVVAWDKIKDSIQGSIVRF